MGVLNKVFLIGKIGQKPDAKTFNSGMNNVRFPLATNEKYKKGDEFVKKTVWHNVVAWGKLASIVEKIMNKGDDILVEGKIEYREFKDKDGVIKYTTDIVASAMQILKNSELSQSKQGDSYAPQSTDDLPF